MPCTNSTTTTERHYMNTSTLRGEYFVRAANVAGFGGKFWIGEAKQPASKDSVGVYVNTLPHVDLGPIWDVFAQLCAEKGNPW